MANPITNIYTANEKTNGQVLSAEDWNGLASAVETAHSTINSIISEGVSSNTPASNNVTITDVTEQGGDTTANVAVVSGIQDLGSPNVIQLTKKKKGVNTTIVSGNNVNIEPRESVGETKGGNISFKPGDDIEFCSHHRLAANQDEVSMKIIDGDDNPVKLQLNAAEMTLTTKDKTGSDANVFDINVNSGKNTKGYLKVRAQAIDLRCEENGGIALQPKGSDGDGHENKIKFEHDGGDGVEFGTFNSEKTSIYTDEYRFKDDGQVYAVTRGAVATQSYKEDGVTPKKVDYPTQSDDFKDIITSSTPHASWNSIVNAGKNAYKLSYFAVATGVYVVPLTAMPPASEPSDSMTFFGTFTPFQHQGFYEEDGIINKTVNVGDIYTDNTLASKIAALPYASSTGNERVHYLKSPSFWEDFFGYVAPVTLLPNPGQDPLYDAVQFYAQNQYLVFKVSDQYYCLVPSSEVVDMMVNVPKHGWLSLGDLKTMLSNA